MTALADIRQGIADSLAGLPGVQVSAYMLGNPTLPVVWVRPDPAEGVDYHRAMHNGQEDWLMQIQAYVTTSGTLDIGAQKLLDEMIDSTGAKSVKALVEADKTLGGIVDDLVVQRCSGYLEYSIGGTGMTALGAEWTVLVIT